MNDTTTTNQYCIRVFAQKTHFCSYGKQTTVTGRYTTVCIDTHDLKGALLKTRLTKNMNYRIFQQTVRPGLLGPLGTSQ